MTTIDNALPTLAEVEEVCRQAGFVLSPQGSVVTENASGPKAPDVVGEYSQEALRGLLTYLELLYDWGKEMNLVGKRNWRDTLEVLILDSFHLAEFLRALQKSGSLASGQELESWDLGAGAGLPGIPLRLLWQDGHYFLVEERKKRVLFMEAFLERNPLPRTTVFCGRAEKFMKARKADLIVSRAFMPYAKLLPLVRGTLKPGAAGNTAGPAGMTIIMSNDPAPQNLPGWSLVAEQPYATKGGVRYFWALRPE